VNPFALGSDTVLCRGGLDMTTLTVLAALVAAPFLFGVLLAVALAVVMALHFGRGLISPAASG
jgi:hypothetical protein